MRSWIALAALACGMFGVTTASAAPGDPLKDQFYIAPSVLFLGSNGKQSLNSYASPQIGLGVQFTDRFALEGVYGDGNTDTDGGGNVDVNADYYRLDGIYGLGGEYWKPYLAAGIGKYHLDPHLAPKYDDTQLNVGLGLMRALSPRLSVRGDARFYYQVDARENTPGLSLGLRYVFGGPTGPRDADGDGVTDATDQCPATPAGTRVGMNGCELDSDRDGVADGADACPNTPVGVVVDSRGCPRDSDGDGVIDHVDACPNTPRGDKVDAKGCTIEKPKPAVSERMSLKLEFDYDSAKLRPSHYAEIEKVADFMRAHPDTSAQLEGHTDSRGTEAYNQALSERRAYSVRDYLIDKADIDPRRITAVGYGESKPIAPNDTDAGRQANRRVEAVIETREMSVRQRRDN